MIRVKASEFAKNFGRYKQLAQREPVEVTSHDTVGVYVISPGEFARYKELASRERQAFYVHELPAAELEEIVNGRMDSRHDHLNKLMEE